MPKPKRNPGYGWEYRTIYFSAKNAKLVQNLKNTEGGSFSHLVGKALNFYATHKNTLELSIKQKK